MEISELCRPHGELRVATLQYLQGESEGEPRDDL